MDFFFEGHWRMDWWLGNPNKTAVLIAGLMVVSWSLAFLRKWGFWTALILNAVLGAPAPSALKQAVAYFTKSLDLIDAPLHPLRSFVAGAFYAMPSPAVRDTE